MAAYDISDVGGIEMLAVAASAIDRAERCRERINLDGEMIKTRTGMRSHPLIRDELQALALAMRTIDKLGINHELLKPIGRPGTPLGWVPPEE
jgi:hypothetical protein